MTGLPDDQRDDRRSDRPGSPVVRTTTVGVGDAAPSVVLPAHDGSEWRLRDQRGRRVLMIYHRHLG